MEVLYEDLKKDVLVELAIYIRNHVVYACRGKDRFNACVAKILKVHTRAIRRL